MRIAGYGDQRTLLQPRQTVRAEPTAAPVSATSHHTASRLPSSTKNVRPAALCPARLRGFRCWSAAPGVALLGTRLSAATSCTFSSQGGVMAGAYQACLRWRWKVMRGVLIVSL